MTLPRYPEYKSSGVEWLGEVPGHWDVKRLKRNLQLLTEKTERREHPVALENIESWSGRFVESETEFQGEGIAFERGDILFGKLRPYLAKAYLAETAGEAVGDFHVMRPSVDVDGRFAQYHILNRDFITIVDGSTFGAKMPRASWDFLCNMALATPPKKEQQAIAAFLDRETGKIDALIAEQRRLMELLKEKRQAVISHAVTKGLPSTSSGLNAKMKDSGIEWLGDVPAHWEVFSLRRCLQEHRQGYYTTDPYVDSGIRLLRITDLRGYGNIDYSESPYVDERPELSQFLLQESDFIFARTGGAGLFGVVGKIETPIAYASYLIRFRFDKTVHTNFLRYFFLSPCFQDALKKNIHGGVNQNIHAEDIKCQSIAIPPMDEQVAIASFLDTETAKFDTLTAEANRTIELLQERRSALISAAVTGKIDVRGYGA